MKKPPKWFQGVVGPNDPPPDQPDDPGPGDEDSSDERTVITYRTGQPGAALRATMDVLPSLGVYQRAGALVQVLAQPTGHPVPVAISEPGLTCLISDRVSYRSVRLVKKDWVEVEVAPPKLVMSAVHSACAWPGIPYLRAITSHPVVRRDGSVMSSPGYDAITQTLSTHDYDLEVEPLSQEGAMRARAELLDLVDEFPFVDASADVWLAAVLTPLVRSWCGPSPMILFTSSTPSSGKGRLADLATTISCGGEGVSGGAVPPNTTEWGKQLIAWGSMGPEVIYFDNVASGSQIGSPVLDMALTRDQFTGRILGLSKMVRVEILALWLAAGNNIGVIGDTARRALICRIEPKCERPELRTFKRSPILEYASKHRLLYLKAALGMLSGWLSTDECRSPTPPLGSFEEWSRVVRGAIIWAGGDDVADALASQVDRADDGADIHRALLEAWRDALPNGATAAQVLAQCSGEGLEDLGDEHPLPELIAEICPGRGGHKYGSAKTLSREIRAMELRPRAVDGVELRLARQDKKGAISWCVEEVS